jgi:hypothetical protein
MKFICNHPRTKDALAKWTGTQEVLSFSFFFWNSGTELRMSQEGLLRSFLIQALDVMPELANVIFEHRFEAWALSLPPTSVWSWRELVQAFYKLLHEITTTKNWLCS